MHIKFNNFTLNTIEKVLSYDDNFIKLNWKTFSVLKLLLDNKEQVVSREKFIFEVWDDNFIIGDKALSTAIWNLRLHIKDSVLIQTIPRVGYSLIINKESLNIENIEAPNQNHLLRKPLIIFFLIITSLIIAFFTNKYLSHTLINTKTTSILFLNQNFGGDRNNPTDKFIKNIETRIKNNSQFTLVSSEIKNKILNEDNINVAAIEENIESIIYISVSANSTQQCNISVRYELLKINEMQSKNWSIGCDKLNDLTPEILQILSHKAWK